MFSQQLFLPRMTTGSREWGGGCFVRFRVPKLDIAGSVDRPMTNWQIHDVVRFKCPLIAVLLSTRRRTRVHALLLSDIRILL